jgi:hypothetical protein
MRILGEVHTHIFQWRQYWHVAETFTPDFGLVVLRGESGGYSVLSDHDMCGSWLLVKGFTQASPVSVTTIGGQHICQFLSWLVSVWIMLDHVGSRLIRAPHKLAVLPSPVSGGWWQYWVRSTGTVQVLLRSTFYAIIILWLITWRFG